jgi:hypothetical protein
MKHLTSKSKKKENSHTLFRCYTWRNVWTWSTRYVRTPRSQIHSEVWELRTPRSQVSRGFFEISCVDFFLVKLCMRWQKTVAWVFVQSCVRKVRKNGCMSLLAWENPIIWKSFEKRGYGYMDAWVLSGYLLH